MRKLVAWLTLLVVLAGMGVPALATDNTGISPFYVNVLSTDITLTFDGATAKCSSLIQGYSGTTKITATYTLLRKETNGSYTTVKAWVQSASGTVLDFSETCSITKGYTYRLSVSASVTRNGTTEAISDWVENKC